MARDGLFKADRNKKPGAMSGLKGEFLMSYLFKGDGTLEKYSGLAPDMLREIAQKVIPIAAIINIRLAQLRPFNRPSKTKDDVGFQIVLKDDERHPKKDEIKEMKEIKDFILECGNIDLTKDDEFEKDDIQGFSEKFRRDVLTLDQIAIVPRYDVKGTLCEYRYIDPATIYLVNPEIGYEGNKKIKYVQRVDGKVVETFTRDELIFDCLNKRSDIRKNYYGYPLPEMCIDAVLGFLNAVSYNNEYFSSGTMPKGFFTSREKNFDQQELEEFQRYFFSMFSGVKNAWRTLFMQGDWKYQSIRPSNQDLEFNQYLQTITAWICAIYKIDAQELGLRLNQAQNVLNENNESKLKYSNDRGLGDLLTFEEGVYNKLLRLHPTWGDKYCFQFTGLKPRDKKGEVELQQMQSKVYMTVNEIRALNDLKPLPEGEGDIILDSVYMQNKQQMAMQEQQSSEEMGMEGEEQPEEDNESVVNDALEESDFGKSQEMIEFEIEF